MSNSLDHDQARRVVGPNLGPNCLPRLSADDIDRQRVKYCNSPKFWIPKYCCNHPKILTNWLYSREMSPKDADGIANSEDPDQTAPLEAV